MAERYNPNQQIDNSLLKGELESLVDLFAVYLPDPNRMGQWLSKPTFTMTAVEGDIEHSGDIADILTQPPFKFIIDGIVYPFVPTPIEITGIEYTAESAMPHPNITMANLKLPGFNPDAFLGARLRYIQTFTKYQNTDTSLPVQTFIVDAIKEETFMYISYDLVAPYDVQGIKLPGRRIVGGQCPWVYKAGTPSIDDRKHNFIATDTPRGGCTWPTNNLHTTGGTQSLIFMNSNDEYVVDCRLIPHATNAWEMKPADLGVTATSYYYTTDTTYKLNHLGDKEPNLSVVYRYWQALVDQPLLGLEEPQSESNKWREVRVYKPYTSDDIFCGYIDPRYNDYVSINQGGTQVGINGLSNLVGAYEFTTPITLNTVISIENFDEVFATGGGKALRLSISAGTNLETLANIIADPNYNNDLKVSINTRSDTATGTFAEQPGIEQVWKSLPVGSISFGGAGDSFYNSRDNNIGWNISAGEMFLVDETNMQYFTGRRANTEYSLWLGLGAGTTEQTLGKAGFINANDATEFLSLWIHSSDSGALLSKQIYQVKSKTLDITKMSNPLEHGPFPPTNSLAFNFNNWTAGDQCSKTLDGCVKRFQAAPIDAEQVKAGTINESGPASVWYMTPSHSGADQNIFAARIPTSNKLQLSNTIADQRAIHYFKCTDQAVFDNLPDEGVVEIEAYIGDQWRKDYPFKDQAPFNGGSTTRISNKNGVDNYYFDETEHGAATHNLSLPLDSQYYFIKMTPTISPLHGRYLPGFGTGGLATPSDRQPLMSVPLPFDYNTPDGERDTETVTLRDGNTASITERDSGGVDTFAVIFYPAEPPSFESEKRFAEIYQHPGNSGIGPNPTARQIGNLRPEVYFSENLDPEFNVTAPKNGIAIFRYRKNLTTLQVDPEENDISTITPSVMGGGMMGGDGPMSTSSPVVVDTTSTPATPVTQDPATPAPAETGEQAPPSTIDNTGTLLNPVQVSENADLLTISVPLDPASAPFIRHPETGKFVERGLGDYGIEDLVPAICRTSSTDYIGASSHSSSSAIYNDQWVQPLLKDKDDNVIPNGTLDPVHNTAYRFKFSIFEKPENSVLSSELSNSVELPFGGFPGSRRFK